MKDGGPAFPSPGYVTSITGMSLRDWFAGMALKEILLSGGWGEYETLAKGAYIIADAMIKEREK